MAGEDTFLTIDGTPTQSIPLDAFKPTLPQWVGRSLYLKQLFLFLF
jgi:hypothetical protein